MLKIDLVFKNIQTLQVNQEGRIFRVLFLHEFEYMGRFSNRH